MHRRLPAFCVAALLALSARTAMSQDTAAVRRFEGRWSKPVGDTSRLLYHGYGYGSDAYNSPLTVMWNKGFDIFQLRLNPRKPFDFSYKSTWHHGIRPVFQRPVDAIERFGGWNRFTRVELFPLSFDFYEMNWIANYTEHLLGGGITMRLLDEWYRAHGVPFPRVMAMLNTYAASILNEVSEQPNVLGFGASGVADLLFFDIAALLLFHGDQPTRFFARTLEFADWSNQAALTLPNEQLQNNGQYWTIKIPIGMQRTRLFLRGGLGAQLGISRRLDDEHHLSVGLGGDTEVRDVDERTGHETIQMALGAGVYYDRNNSLLWSVAMSPAANLIAVNVFPGWVPALPRHLGLWSVYTRHREFRIGVVHGALGLGLGYGR